MEVSVIKVLEDNFAYILVDRVSGDAAVVDPQEPKKVYEAVKSAKLNLKAILTTHHHWDHADGNRDFVKFCENDGVKVDVYGGDDRIPQLTTKVQHGDRFKIGSLSVTALFTPCHTTGHICYYVTNPVDDKGAVFTGDTLFVAGCGRFFEGTPEQMHHALNTVLGGLPPTTMVYVGHEYTLANLKFAAAVEPANRDITDLIEASKRQIESGEPTVPSTIAQEKKTNPFMRVTENSVQQFTGETNPVAVMGVLREKKNNFK